VGLQDRHGLSGVEGAQVVASRIRIGTRKSVMALAQTEEIARRLNAVAPDIDVEIVKFETTGDSSDQQAVAAWRQGRRIRCRNPQGNHFGRIARGDAFAEGHAGQ